jgi:NitT/TauT family transport system permease protein
MPVDSDVVPLDAMPPLVVVGQRGPSRLSRIWKVLWPKLLAVGMFLGIWQLVVWSGWRPEYLLPSPATVAKAFVDDFSGIWDATVVTLQRGVKGFTLALIIGGALGLAVSRSKILRSGIGSMITGLQTMPSVAWFPLAILLFKATEEAIMFVVILGAAPSIANGLIQGVDQIPPILLRAGRVLGARGWDAVRHVMLPAALPSFVGGLKQGWAFAWRSLMAGELLTLIPGKVSLGAKLEFERQFSDSAGMLAVMVMIFIIGVTIDALIFGQLDRFIRRRYGLIDTAR